ncbi:secretion activating protein, partial [Escherichia coli]|nr:secretion activating protein [Escherichia coli]
MANDAASRQPVGKAKFAAVIVAMISGVIAIEGGYV